MIGAWEGLGDGGCGWGFHEGIVHASGVMNCKTRLRNFRRAIAGPSAALRYVPDDIVVGEHLVRVLEPVPPRVEVSCGQDKLAHGD